jgi:tellurite resistance protein
MKEINMAALKQFDMTTGEHSKTDNLLYRLFAIPPNFFSITMGLAGLAGAWRLAGNLYGFPAQIGDILYLTTAMVYLLLVIVFAAKLVLTWKTIIAEFNHPVMGPFNSLLPITGMLLAVGLEPHAHYVAQAMFLVFLTVTLLLGGWMTGRWIASKLDGDAIHSGYILPTVAGGLIGSDGLARFGIAELGWMSFGAGIISWLLLGSIILNRLFSRPSLPSALIPTLAIEVAPPVVAGNAYFLLTGGSVNILTYMLAGYAVLMILMQLRLLPVYSKLAFTPSFWSFTFPYAAVAVYTMRWINLEHPIGAMLMGRTVLAAVTLLTSGIALRSLVALRQGKFLSTTAVP